MANELTDKTKVVIEKILSQQAFHKAEKDIALFPATPPCKDCVCESESGQIRAFGTHFQIPNCIKNEP